MFGRDVYRWRGWDPYRDLDRLQDEMNRMFSGIWGTRSWALDEGARLGAPALNVHTGPEGAIVTLELSGVRSDDVDISVLGRSLSVKAVRKPAEDLKDYTVHRQERVFGEFMRTVELPFDVDANKITASLRDGVLEVFAPMQPEEKPRRIEVKAS